MDTQKLHGVNLGGWLILEKWMTPHLFARTNAEDEYCFCLELGKNEAEKTLQEHWKTFITKEDFIWIKEQNLNSIRIPIGYWNIEGDEPFISSAQYFEKALDWAEETGLNVVIDLHGAPGSQNGWDHSGRIGEVGWRKSPENIERSLVVIEELVKKYGNRKAVVGIELLNEPHWDITLSTLQTYYKKCYEIIRANCNKNIAVIMHDSFRPWDWEKFFRKNNFENVCLDIHLYQCFEDSDKKMNLEGHLHKTRNDWNQMIRTIQEYVPVIVGEWSIGLDPQSLPGMNEEEIKEAKRLYFEAQLETFEQAKGWFFWTYKLDNDAMKQDWSYKDSVISSTFFLSK